MPQSWREPEFRSAPVLGVLGRSTVENSGSTVKSHALVYLDVAAPEDGRAPPMAYPAVAEGLHSIARFSCIPQDWQHASSTETNAESAAFLAQTQISHPKSKTENSLWL